MPNLRESESCAVNVATDFRIGKNHTFYFKPLHSSTAVDASRYLSRPYIDTRFQDAINGRKTFEFHSFGRGRGIAGANGSRGEIRYNAEESETHTNLYAFSAGGRHERGASTLNYDGYFRHTHYVRTLDSDFIVRNIRAARGYFTWEYDSRNALSPQVWVVDGLDPRDLSGVTRGDLSIQPEERWENAYTGKVDWERKFVGERMAGALKFGAKYAQTKQRFEQDQFEYDTTATFPYAQVMKSGNRSINGSESYNRSYARPTISRLTLGRSEDINGNIAEGNPLLDPTTSHNLDVQLEKYTDKGGLYSAGLFWKKMKGFYYNSDQRLTDADPVSGDPIIDPQGTRRYRLWQNAEGATNYGIELIVQQKMYFLLPVLRGLTANVSATFGKSRAEYGALRRGENLPTFGFSDTMFNAALDYAIGKFRANVRYAYRADYLTGIGDNRYVDDTFAAREQVDVEASYRLTRKFRINANVINLTSRPQVSYQSFPAYVEDNSNSGWRATVGMDYTF